MEGNDSNTTIIVKTTDSASLDYLFGLLELTSCVVGFVLNTASIGYFFKKRTSPTYLLYLLIGN